MKTLRAITFEGVEYKIRGVRLPSVGFVEVSTLSLENALLDEDGIYISNEAQEIDESLFYYVEENEIDLPEAEIIELLEKVI